MILKKRLENRGGRRGFTLVEVIVVLVILAILAAIAIPALTGYIKKAEDKKWISDARDKAVAMRTVINEEYANGLQGKMTAENFDKFVIKGNTTNYTYLKSFSPVSISMNSGSGRTAIFYFDEATKLMGGTKFPQDIPGHWYIELFADKSSDETAFNVSAFLCKTYPEGTKTTGVPRIFVTYKLTAIDSDIKTESDFNTAIKSVSYDKNAGYQVYYMN
jgi:prepilin-type N-terminal cleavage/methylation domain-containing protein